MLSHQHVTAGNMPEPSYEQTLTVMAMSLRRRPRNSSRGRDSEVTCLLESGSLLMFDTLAVLASTSSLRPCTSSASLGRGSCLRYCPKSYRSHCWNFSVGSTIQQNWPRRAPPDLQAPHEAGQPHHSGAARRPATVQGLPTANGGLSPTSGIAGSMHVSFSVPTWTGMDWFRQMRLGLSSVVQA